MTESYKIDNDFVGLLGKFIAREKKEKKQRRREKNEMTTRKERINGERKGKKEWREETIYKGDEAVERRKEKGSKFRVQSIICAYTM